MPEVVTRETLPEAHVRTSNRAGVCSVCQQTVMLRPNTGHRHVRVAPSDPLWGDPVTQWVLADHEIAGTLCRGSGDIPQGITGPLTDDEVERVLARVVHRL